MGKDSRLVNSLMTDKLQAEACEKKMDCEELKRLQRLCSRMDKVIDSSYDGIYITDGEANTLFANKSYEEMTGVKLEDVIGRNMKDITKDGIISESGTLKVLKTKRTATIEQTFKNGKTCLISSNPIFDDEEKDKIIMVVTNVRDITLLNELQNKLNVSEERTRRYQTEIESIKSQALINKKIIGKDEQIKKILIDAKKIAPHNLPVLLLGESGVGKEVFARYIYENSKRRDKYFFKVNCGAIPVNLIESQLFGYEKGAFTGADSHGRMGIFETANGGTVFLDEIGELPLDMQVKFLRVLQEQEIVRVGGNKTIKIDVRIIAATNRDLQDRVKRGLFREDLFYRLNVLPFTIPPLRDRKDDIPLFIEGFTNEINERLGFEKVFDKESIDILKSYHWPGNIRELRNIVERVVVMSSNDLITKKDLPIEVDLALSIPNIDSSSEGIDLDEMMKAYEGKLLNLAYERFGNVRAAAKFLKIHPSTFVRRRQRDR